MKTSSAHFDSTINAAIFYKKRGICSQTHGFLLLKINLVFFVSNDKILNDFETRPLTT